MSASPSVIPVVVFAYARPHLLQQVLNHLRDNHIPKLIAFSDAPRTPDQKSAVAAVRGLLHAVDWCHTEIYERDINLGLGKSILAGMTQVFDSYNAAIVFEDDLICVEGTYRYFVEALNRYQNVPTVMSITAWNNTELIPSGLQGRPYFDGRTESWGWATWRRAWEGLTPTNAITLLRQYRHTNGNICYYGEDIPGMALMESERNLWLVRWILWHLLKRGLCLRPPHTMIEHIGYSPTASNATMSEWMQDDRPQAFSLNPIDLPSPQEHPDAARLWRLHRYHYWRRLTLEVQLRAQAGLVRRMVRERFFYLPYNRV